MPTASKVNIDAIENKNMRQQGCSRQPKKIKPKKIIY